MDLELNGKLYINGNEIEFDNLEVNICESKELLSFDEVMDFDDVYADEELYLSELISDCVDTIVELAGNKDLIMETVTNLLREIFKIEEY